MGRSHRRWHVRHAEPATGEAIASVAAGTRLMSIAPSKPRARRWNRPVEPDGRRRSGRLLFKLAGPGRSARSGAGGARVAQTAADDHDSIGRHAGGRQSLRYYGRLGRQIEGKTVPVRANFLSYTLRQPVGCHRTDHSLEFPAADAGLEMGPALACGQYDRHEAANKPLTALRVGELAIEAGFPPGSSTS